MVESSHFFNRGIQELLVDLPSYEDRMAQGKSVVFYRIRVTLGSRHWELWKRYSQFESLDADLRTKHPQLPRLPGKTFFRLAAKEDIGQRREQLHNYLQDIVIHTFALDIVIYIFVYLLQDIVNRQDLRTNAHFRDFLELDTQIPESVVNQPVKVAELPDLNLGGRDFVLLRELGLLFVAESDMNVASRLDSYFTNMTLPWEKGTQSGTLSATVGALVVYRVKIEEGDQWRFDRMWTKAFSSQTNSLHWCADMETLFVGLDNGSIVQLFIPKEYNHMRYQEVSE